MKCKYCRRIEHQCDGCCADCEKRLVARMKLDFDFKDSKPNPKYYGVLHKVHSSERS